MSTTTITRRPLNYRQEMIAIAKRSNIGQDIVLHKFIQSFSSTIALQKDLTPARLGQLSDELMPLSTIIPQRI